MFTWFPHRTHFVAFMVFLVQVTLLPYHVHLGRGCYLRPALFDDGFGIDATFLISLPFLLKTRGQLVLDQKQGLQLRLSEPNCVIKIHLGPSGALRVPLMQFDDQVLNFLKTSQQVLERSEFEIFDLTSESSPMMEQEAQGLGAISSQPSPSTSQHRHGGAGHQTCSGRTSVQCTAGVGSAPQEAALPHLPAR